MIQILCTVCVDKNEHRLIEPTNGIKPHEMSASMTQLTVLIGAVLTFVGMMVIGVNALYTVSWNAGWAILGVFTSLAFLATLAGFARTVVVARATALVDAPKAEGATAAAASASASAAPAAVAVSA